MRYVLYYVNLQVEKRGRLLEKNGPFNEYCVTIMYSSFDSFRR